MGSKLRWWLLQRLMQPARFYGDGGTWHHSTVLDVEVYKGKVVAVWFRCARLPFVQCDVEKDRAREMQQATIQHPRISGVCLVDPK